jgi:hypothetical protein
MGPGIRRSNPLYRLLMELDPVRNTSSQRTHMNKVEQVFLVGPLQVDVVDLEVAVRRHEPRLDRR